MRDEDTIRPRPRITSGAESDTKYGFSTCDELVMELKN